MSRPVELIVINALHDILDKVDATQVPAPIKSQILDELFQPFGNEVVARTILERIATQTSIRVVLKALAAAGAPSTLPEIRERLIATRDSRKVSTEKGTAQ